ncbi:MAG: SUMF1/EgtB/PvdO family nonheme iron enzyme, partial [candidate division WS1 bacterium]|nr:SUMF1/EgtB/PvdO family nonheme iron enzyme [candidate division WS1 bacterium]
ALAEGELETVLYGGPWILPAVDEGLRAWAQAWQAIPELEYLRISAPAEPVACWSAERGRELVFYLVNRTDLPREVAIRFSGEARAVQNLVTGRLLDAKETTLTLEPFMVAVLRASGVSGVSAVEMLNRGLPVGAGEYVPGAAEIERASGTPVKIAAFVMDRFEITNSLYERFDPEHRKLRDQHSPGDNFPVVQVSWNEALRFCNWRSRQEGLQPCYDETTGGCDFSKNGYRLPTETEWEYAARGTDGRLYPWGAEELRAGGEFRCNAGGYEVDRSTDPGLAKGDGYEYAAPVGSYPEKYASPFGISDLAGNVWEWCQPVSERASPALRGGGWSSDDLGVRCVSRVSAPPDTSLATIGFRCVRNSPGATPAPVAVAARAQASVPWGEQSGETRLLLVLQETQGVKREQELVVIPGRQILDRLPGARLDTRSLQMVHAGTALPTQVDEKDGTGEYVAEPNHVLDTDDEVCFQASLAGESNAQYWLYLSTQPQGRAQVETDLVWEENPGMSTQKPYHLLLKNTALEVGISGVETLEGDKDKWKTYHPGAISYLRKGDMNLFRFYDPNSGLPPRVWPATPERPTLVCQGPVRLVASVKFEPVDLDWHWTANWAWDGELKNARRTHLYTLAAGSRAIDLTITVDYDSAKAKPFKELWHYIVADIGRQGLQPDQVVYYQEGGQRRQTELSVLNEKLVEGKLADHAALGGNREGLIGQYDPTTRTGFAIFGVPWVNQLRSTLFKGAAFGNRNYGACFYVHYSLDEVPPRRIIRPFRFQVLEGENLEAVAGQNAAYLHPIRVSVERVEQR